MMDIIAGMWSIAPSFPSGSVGMGLLLLRCSVAIALFARISLADPYDFMQAVFAVTGLAVICGLRTSLFAVIGAGIAISMSFRTLSIELSLVTALGALALALVGPGAFSIDARLRGRRTVVLPDTDRQ